jgi:hypothetical protein
VFVPAEQGVQGADACAPFPIQRDAVGRPTADLADVGSQVKQEARALDLERAEARQFGVRRERERLEHASTILPRGQMWNINRGQTLAFFRGSGRVARVEATCLCTTRVFAYSTLQSAQDR